VSRTEDPRSTAPDDADLYRALVETIPAIFYIDRPDELSTNYYTSPQAVGLLGYSQEEWGTSPDLWVAKIHPDDRARVVEENERSNASGEPFLSEYRMQTKDGRIVWIRDEAVMVFDDEGRPLHWRGLMLDVTAQKEAEEKLRWSLDVLRRTIQQRRELAQRLERAQEEERRRVAADIHDDPIQVMSAVDLRLQMLAGSPADVTAAELSNLHQTVVHAIERLRSLVFELRPAALDRDGLCAALRLYLEHTARETGWTTKVLDQVSTEPGAELRAMLYRIALEAIGNARKHANAQNVEVRAVSAADGVMVLVRDDGVGFDPAVAAVPRPGHLGLATMVERAELLGGWCRVNSRAGSGTTVECWLPWGGASEEVPHRTA
jgi:PAS domain S-box-containing protein